MYVFLAVLIVIAALLLIGAVLVQKSKGGGLASNYAGGNQYMGYRKTTDFIEKVTWGLAITICVLSILCAFTIKSPKSATGPVTAPQNIENNLPAPGQGSASTPAQKADAKPAAAQPAAAQPAAAQPAAQPAQSAPAPAAK